MKPPESRSSSGVVKKVFALETLDKDPSLPSGYMSVSQVDMYLRCPKQYEFRYIDKLKVPPGIALVEGSSHMSAVEFDAVCFINSGEYEDEDTVIEYFEDDFSTSSKTIPKDEWIRSGESKDNVIKRGRVFIHDYKKIAKQRIKPVSVERKIEVMVGGVPFLGFVDIEVRSGVYDIKVVSRAKTLTDANNDLQLTVYSKALDKEDVAFICFTKTKDPKIEFVRSTRHTADYQAADMLVESVVGSIRKGAFPMCNPTQTFPCSPKWCGYWSICRGKFIKA